MNYILSISFRDSSFRDEIIKFILKNLKFKSIECNKDFKWFKTSKRDLFEIECNQIQFNLTNGGHLVLQNINQSLPKIYGGKIDFETIQIIKGKVEKLFLKSIVNSFVNDYLDYNLQNEEDIDYFKLKKGYFPSYVQIMPNPKYCEGAPGMDMIEKKYINLDSLPGHSHLMNNYEGSDNLWFGSCWQMYFSSVYYKYIPKPLWDDYNDCFEHNVFENGLRKITLFENIEDYDLPENRAKQWAFRRALGIDSIAHEVCPRLNRQQIDPENLPVLITKKNCQIGQTRVTRFLNSNNQLIGSDKAVKVEIKEYLDDGVTVVYECLQDL